MAIPMKEKNEEFNNIPIELRKYNQFVSWKNEFVRNKQTGAIETNSRGERKPTKVPYQLNGMKANATDSSTWTSFEDVYNAGVNIGFVLTDDDPYTVIDLDDCIVNGKITDKAQMVIDTLDSYTEISQSGNGIHIFVKASKPGERSKNVKHNIEMYDNKRFICMTGNILAGSPMTIEDRQEEIDYLYKRYLEQDRPQMNVIDSVGGKSPQMSDNDVLELLRKAKNSDKFNKLFNGDMSHYHDDHSSADQALTNMIAFYSQCETQIDRIFRMSGLMRPKWDRKTGSSTYGRMTIQEAINGLSNVYKPKLNYELHIEKSEIDIKELLQEVGFEERRKMEEAWEQEGKNGRKPQTISPIRCAILLMSHVEFALFDLEENTRVAMYQPDEGIYTRNVTLIKRVISWLEPKHNSNKADEVIYHITNRAEVKEPTTSRYLIPVNNGVFNLKTKKLEPFTSKYIFTTKISTDYVENAKNPIVDGWDIETWLQSIACNDVEIVNLLWQVMNDSLNGNFTRKKAIFLVGDGNNGKGTFQELITNLVGFKNVATLKVNEFEERFRLGVLEGKTVVIGDDVPANVYIDDSSNFNSVVTGDNVLIEQKNKQPYNANFKCGVIQSTNGMPKFRNKTEGTTRRVLIVPFKADFNGEVENFKIKEEYIKNKQVLQYVLFKAINLDFEKFDVPKASQIELDKFKQDNDPVLDFKISEFDTWNIPAVPKSVVYQLYKNYCEFNNFRPLSNREFHHRFKKYLGSDWIDDKKKRFKRTEIESYVGKQGMIKVEFPVESNPLQAYIYDVMEI